MWPFQLPLPLKLPSLRRKPESSYDVEKTPILPNGTWGYWIPAFAAMTEQGQFTKCKNGNQVLPETQGDRSGIPCNLTSPAAPSWQ
jgi:hypothetical protein